jgi:hypothetical protein
MFIDQLKAPSNIGFGLGLQQNMLYDVVASNIGPGTATVNTYTLNVTCGTLGGDTVAVIDPDLADNLTTYAVCDGEKRWVRSVSAFAIIVAFEHECLGVTQPSQKWVFNL